jgi:hypothetical protein
MEPDLYVVQERDWPMLLCHVRMLPERPAITVVTDP